MKFTHNFVALLLVLLTCAGCASSSGAVRNASPIAANKPVSLDSVLVETSSSLDNLDRQKRLLNDSIIMGLRETGLFGNVSGNEADVNTGSGIKISVEIKEIQKVSENARLWFGGIGGPGTNCGSTQGHSFRFRESDSDI